MKNLKYLLSALFAMSLFNALFAAELNTEDYVVLRADNTKLTNTLTKKIVSEKKEVQKSQVKINELEANKAKAFAIKVKLDADIVELKNAYDKIADRTERRRMEKQLRNNEKTQKTLIKREEDLNGRLNVELKTRQNHINKLTTLEQELIEAQTKIKYANEMLGEDKSRKVNYDKTEKKNESTLQDAESFLKESTDFNSKKN